MGKSRLEREAVIWCIAQQSLESTGEMIKAFANHHFENFTFFLNVFPRLRRP